MIKLHYNSVNRFIFGIVIFSTICIACRKENAIANRQEHVSTIHEVIDTLVLTYKQYPNGTTVESRFPTPEGFERLNLEIHSFGNYLRNLPLKPIGAKVEYFNGEIKENYGVYEAVVDLEIGHKNLHQCADAVMRLRADYLWEAERYDEIHFDFTNGFRVDYSEWMQGKRMVVQENNSYWVEGANYSISYSDYWNYMELIFTYAGTLSLSKELDSIHIDSMQIGDIFIQGGSPGHAVIVVDICENIRTNEKSFMLAQSYMPAQEIQILSSPNAEKGGPWYSLNSFSNIETPEWTFKQTDLKRFSDE